MGVRPRPSTDLRPTDCARGRGSSPVLRRSRGGPNEEGDGEVGVGMGAGEGGLGGRGTGG